MKTIGNIIYFIFGGLFSAIAWFIIGVILHITIIGIPFGKQCFKCAKLSLAPFGKTVDLNYSKHPIANTIWVVICGWLLCLMTLFSGVILCITIIGIPFGLQAFKFAKLSLAPFGADIKG
ncbi:MAG: YccF domain-containing protein [bacterium]